MQTIEHIWPNWKALSVDLGLPYTTVFSWKARGRIPADYDDALIAAAERRGQKLTREQLARARPPRRSTPINQKAG